MNKFQISIIIPFYNEEKRLSESIKKILRYLSLKDWDYEIIFVDDGSSDNSVKVIGPFLSDKIILLRNKINKGKGYSIKKGVLRGKNNLVFFTDADLSTPIEELEKLIKYIEDYDIVIGSRAVSGANILHHQPTYRVLIGKFGNFLVRFFLNLKLKDTQCGFKLFKNPKPLFEKQTIDRFGFDYELLFIANKKGLKIKEVPVTWVDKKGSKFRPISDAFICFFDLFKIRYNDFFNKY